MNFSVRHRGTVKEPSLKTLSTGKATPSKYRKAHDASYFNYRRLITFSVVSILVTAFLRLISIGIGSSSFKNATGNVGTFGGKQVSVRFQDTVIGIGADYDINTYRRFVGSLRKSGFQGTIILGMGENRNSLEDAEITSYLSKHNVIVKKILTAKCPYDSTKTCLDEYTSLSPVSAYYTLVSSWLLECGECTESVFLASIQSTHFQSIPFNFSSGRMDARDPSIHLFETPLSTENWRVAMYLDQCKTFKWDVPLLSSIVVGDRMSILFYLETLKKESHDWNNNKNCQTNLHGIELAMINYLFYNGEIRAKVHRYEKSSSGMVSFVTNEEIREWDMGEVEPSSSSIIVLLDTDFKTGKEFDRWIDDQAKQRRHSISTFKMSPLQSMFMEYIPLSEKDTLSKWVERHGGIIKTI